MIFDSRDERCKRPYGAAPCSTVVSLTLRPPVWEDFSQCTMVATAEFSPSSGRRHCFLPLLLKTERNFLAMVQGE